MTDEAGIPEARWIAGKLDVRDAVVCLQAYQRKASVGLIQEWLRQYRLGSSPGAVNALLEELRADGIVTLGRVRGELHAYYLGDIILRPGGGLGIPVVRGYLLPQDGEVTTVRDVPVPG